MVEVVGGIIWRENKFLICRRPANKNCAFLWEFVGGKVEKGESKQDALKRECMEEIGVEISVGDKFAEVTHSYPNIEVHLTLFNASIVRGEPVMREHIGMEWITPQQIPNFEFCPADKEILERLQKMYN